MLRLIASTVLACALFAYACTVADARPKHARIAPQGLTHCPADGSYRTTCGQAEPAPQATIESPEYDDAVIVPHPEGCPRRLFCGCGVSVKAFGKPIRELFLASNYGYYFNPGEFAPGNAAWQSGHVVYILGGTQSDALIYDPNSGNGKTRIHRRDLSRYRIADLRSPKRRLASQ